MVRVRVIFLFFVLGCRKGGGSDPLDPPPSLDPPLCNVKICTHIDNCMYVTVFCLGVFG